MTDFFGSVLESFEGHTGCGGSNSVGLVGSQSTTRIYVNICNVPGGSCAFPPYHLDDYNE